MSEVCCFSCGLKTSFQGQIGRRDECPKCHADLHVCKNCVHYDVTAYNECREPSADVVREKERANFCDYFSAQAQGKSAGQTKQDLLSAAEALFRKK
jgi:hypothetical protein